MSEILLSLKDINFKVAPDKTILHNINLDLFPNSITTIIGPNGGGKTSLLKIILGLNQATSGQIIRHNPNLRIGYLPQKLQFDQSLPLNVESLLKLSPSYCADNYKWLVENLELEAILKTSIHSLSGGERQRAFLARALMPKPNLLVLDEPAQGVDINRQARLYQLIVKIKERFNCAVLLVSHDLTLVMKNTNRVICLNRHICCEGIPVEISRHAEFKSLFGHLVSQNIQEQFGVYEHIAPEQHNDAIHSCSCSHHN